MIQYLRYHKNSIMILNSLLSSPEISGPAKTSSESLKNLTISNEYDGPLSKVDLDDIDLITAIQAEEILNIIYSRGSVKGFLEESELNQSENTNPIIENENVSSLFPYFLFSFFQIRQGFRIPFTQTMTQQVNP